MANNKGTPRVQYRCSFCGKSQEMVHRLIAGPGGVYICNECVALCTEIIVDEGQAAVERVRPLVDETQHRYERDDSLCPLCRSPVGEGEVQLVVATFETGLSDRRHVLWRCHASCFHEESKHLP